MFEGEFEDIELNSKTESCQIFEFLMNFELNKFWEYIWEKWEIVGKKKTVSRDQFENYQQTLNICYLVLSVQ